MIRISLGVFLLGALFSAHASEDPAGWVSTSPRPEIMPEAWSRGAVGEERTLHMKSDNREGLHGVWEKTFPVEGGRYYQWSCERTLKGEAIPRRSAMVKISWMGGNGGSVSYEGPVTEGYFRNNHTIARPDYPADVEIDREKGVARIAGVYRAPSGATGAKVELHFRWTRNATIVWKDMEWKQVAAPPSRKVKLATVHLQPRGGSPGKNNQLYEPLVVEAARKGADLVVLGETISVYGTRLTYAEAAESVPGPTTDYFGKLADRHDLYIVAGLVERDGNVLYNVGVLLGPEGEIVGKYRKTCLPRSEADGGIMPGHEYPVFETRFGRVGIMICYDAFFPEVARQLSANGAEVIALPVWGCNPSLAAARACENHVYVVSSTYTDHRDNWIKTGVFDHQGKLIAQADDWGQVVMAEVDLNQPTVWRGLGDFKARIERGRPVWTIE